jgi:hypothetical protein
MKDKNSLFTEMTAEEAANINGGGWVTVIKLIREVSKRVLMPIRFL